MITTKRKVTNSGGKRKRTKFNRKANVQEVNDSETDSLEGVQNEEEEIDLTIEGTQEDDPLNVPELNNQANLKSPQNSTQNTRVLRQSSLKLRKDLFPENSSRSLLSPRTPKSKTTAKTILKPSNLVPRVIIPRIIKTSSVTSKKMPPLILRKVEVRKNYPPSTKVPKKQQQIFLNAPVVVERDGHMMFVHNEPTNIVIPQQKTQANPKTPHLNIEENKRNIENEELIIIDDDTDVKTNVNIESPLTKTLFLKKLRTEEIPEEVKKAQILLSTEPVKKGKNATTGTAPLKSLILPSLPLNTPTVSTDTNKIAMLILQTPNKIGSKIALPIKTVDNSKTTIQSSVLVQPKRQYTNTKSNTLSAVNLNKSKSNDNAQFQPATTSNSPNESKTSKTGSTASCIKVMNQDVISPSTSNQNSTKVVQKDADRRIIGYHWDDYAQDFSSDDDDDGGELGLNSLKELQDFWELIIEISTYNTQMIKSLQNRRRRHLGRIKTFEKLLNKELKNKTRNDQNDTIDLTSAEIGDSNFPKKSTEE